MYIKAEAIPPLNALEFVPPAGVPHSWLHGATGFGPIWGSCTEAGGYCTVLPSTITVSAGELLRRTVTFTCLFLGGDSSETTEPEPPGEGYPPRDEPSSRDTDSDLPWDEPSWDELPWDESGDDYDDDDDLDDDMLERLCPQGGIRLRWSAAFTAARWDDSGIASAPFSQAAARNFETLSGLRIRLVSDDFWTGPGSIGDARRMVNFNHSGDGEKNATEQT